MKKRLKRTRDVVDNIIVIVVVFFWFGSAIILISDLSSSDNPMLGLVFIGMCGVAALVVMCILMAISKLIFLVIKKTSK